MNFAIFNAVVNRSESQSDRIRITWTDFPRDKVEIQELPTKPVKRHLRRASFDIRDNLISRYGKGEFPHAFMVDNIQEEVRLDPQMSYEEAVGVLQAHLRHLIAETPGLAEYEREGFLRMPWESVVYYLEVPPADYAPLVVEGADFSLKSEWTKFSAYSPDSDFQQADPYYTVIESPAPASARKLHNILRRDPDALRSVSWKGLDAWLTANGVGYEYHHSVWH